MRRILCLLPILLLGACQSAPQLGGAQSGGAQDVAVIEASALPLPVGITEGGDRPFHIGANDELLIDVVGFADLTARRIRTDANGSLSVPIAGPISAMGLTPRELENAITQQMREAHVRNPVVSVNVSEVRSQLITVDGQVKEPGIFPVIGRMSLMQAVARAKGLTETARLEDVVVFRTVGDERMVALYNLQAIRRGNYADPEVFANDVVVVGDSSGRRLFQNILQVGAILAGPIVAIIQGVTRR
ncbi:MAG: polysaccharide biosynthesis/export family protein [Sphingopyxis sp.]